MGASYEEFAAQHRTQHVTPFNRWCAVVGNSLAPVAIITALTGRPKAGATLYALGTATLAAGHVAEGNLPRNVRDFVGPYAPMSPWQQQRSSRPCRSD